MNKFNGIKKWRYLLVACFLGSCNTNKATLNMKGSSLKYPNFLNTNKRCLRYNESRIPGGYLKKFYTNRVDMNTWKNTFRSRGQNYYNKRKTFDRKKTSFGTSIKKPISLFTLLVGASLVVKNQDEDNRNDYLYECDLTELSETDIREKLDFAVMILQDPKLALMLIEEFTKSDFENLPIDSFGNNILYYMVKKKEFNEVSKKIIGNCLPIDLNIINNNLNLLIVSYEADNYDIFNELVKKGQGVGDESFLPNLILFFKKHPPEVEIPNLISTGEIYIEGQFE